MDQALQRPSIIVAYAPSHPEFTNLIPSSHSSKQIQHHWPSHMPSRSMSNINLHVSSSRSSSCCDYHKKEHATQSSAIVIATFEVSGFNKQLAGMKITAHTITN